MAGIIQQQQGTGQTITPQSIRAKMNIPPNLMQAYLAIVTAGRKILYSPQMAPHIQQLLQAPGDIGTKLGQGVAAVLGMIFGESKGTMPKQLIVPAGTELVAQAAELARASGQQVTDKDIGQGIKVMIQMIVAKTQGAQQQPGQAPAAPAPGGAPQPAAPAGA